MIEFKVPASIGGSFAEVVGEFLSWVPLPMDRRTDGSFVVTIGLESGRCWRYRFLIDGDRSINDWDADDFVSTEDGSIVSVLNT